MKWISAELYEKIETGKDKLGNPIYKLKSLELLKVRVAPWTIEETEQLGQSFTKSHIKLITPEKFYSSQCLPWTIEIQGHSCEVESVKKLGNRFTALLVKAVKL